ncbi:MAG: phosphoglycerate dehydrogenase [Actinomycetia bacterium]|nr:phosphoglycerate dehydrogenase [Actinomycetes bacterium]
MGRIRTYNAISKVGLDRLDGYQVGPDVPDPQGVLVRSARLSAAELPASVLGVARAGAGTNNIPVAELSARGVVVFNTPGANANAVKELVIAGMLLAARNLVPALDFAGGLEGDDVQISEAAEKGKKSFVGFELPGRTLGVVGLGAIGVQIANAAQALGMRVLGYDPQITIRHAWQLSADVERAATVEDVFSRADLLTVHVPLVEATRDLVSAERLALMKPGAVLLNFARGGIVDEAAVLAALDADRLGWYVCDFPSSALVGHPDVITLPHLGASTAEAEDNCAVMAAEQLRAFLERGEITNSVNFPSASLRRSPGTRRIVIANSNVPNMVGQISTLLAGAGLNIADLLNTSRGELAYTLIDVEGEVGAEVLASVRGISGVLSARVL